MPFRAAKRLTRMSTVARRCRIYPILPFATCHFKSQPLDPITLLATFVRHKFVAQENKVIQLGGRLESGGGGKIILWARHAHIDQVTGWLSDKQTGSPMLIMQICRPNWFAAEEAAGKRGRLPLATVSARRKTKRGVCAISPNNKIHRKIYANIWQIHRWQKAKGIRHANNIGNC